MNNVLIKPIHPKAKFFSHCKSCGQILIRMPTGGPHNALCHLIIEDDEIIGWHLGPWCRNPPLRNKK